MVENIVEGDNAAPCPAGGDSGVGPYAARDAARRPLSLLHRNGCRVNDVTRQGLAKS